MTTEADLHSSELTYFSSNSDDLFGNDSGQNKSPSGSRMTCEESSIVLDDRSLALNMNDLQGNNLYDTVNRVVVNDSQVMFRPITPDSISKEFISSSPPEINKFSTPLVKVNKKHLELNLNASVIPHAICENITSIAESDSSEPSILDHSQDESSEAYVSIKPGVISSAKKPLFKLLLSNTTINKTPKIEQKCNSLAEFCVNDNKLKENESVKELLDSQKEGPILTEQVTMEQDNNNVLRENKTLGLNLNIKNIQNGKEECEKSPKPKDGYNLRRNRRGKENANNNIDIVKLFPKVMATPINDHLGKKTIKNKIPKQRKNALLNSDDENNLSNIFNSVMSIKKNNDEAPLSTRRKGLRKINVSLDDSIENEPLNLDCYNTDYVTPRRKLFFRNPLNNSLDDEAAPIDNSSFYTNRTPATQAKSKRLKGLNAFLNDTMNSKIENSSISSVKNGEKKQSQLIENSAESKLLCDHSDKSSNAVARSSVEDGDVSGYSDINKCDGGNESNVNYECAKNARSSTCLEKSLQLKTEAGVTKSYSNHSIDYDNFFCDEETNKNVKLDVCNISSGSKTTGCYEPINGLSSTIKNKSDSDDDSFNECTRPSKTLNKVISTDSLDEERQTHKNTEESVESFQEESQEEEIKSSDDEHKNSKKTKSSLEPNRSSGVKIEKNMSDSNVSDSSFVCLKRGSKLRKRIFLNSSSDEEAECNAIQKRISVTGCSKQKEILQDKLDESLASLDSILSLDNSDHSDNINGHQELHNLSAEKHLSCSSNNSFEENSGKCLTVYDGTNNQHTGNDLKVTNRLSVNSSMKSLYSSNEINLINNNNSGVNEIEMFEHPQETYQNNTNKPSSLNKCNSAHSSPYKNITNNGQNISSYSHDSSSKLISNGDEIVISDNENNIEQSILSKSTLEENILVDEKGPNSFSNVITFDDSWIKTKKLSKRKNIDEKYDPDVLIVRGHDGSYASDIETDDVCYTIDDSESSSKEDAKDEPWSDLASYLKKNIPAGSVHLDNSFANNKKRLVLDVTLPSYSDSPDHTSFLLSLTECVPLEMCHPEAVKYRESFDVHKNRLIDLLFKLFNEEIFENKLPPIEIRWSGRLTTTSGITKSTSKITKTGKIRTSGIKLSKTIVDNASKLRDVLLHELCHAANWLIDEQAGGHGPLFKKWTYKARIRFPEIPRVKVCHRYELKWKYTYKCTYCGYEVGKMKLSLKEDTCRLCGALVKVNY